MSLAVAYAAVLVAAATPWLEVLLVVPAGIVAGLPPVPTAIVAFVGNAATLALLVLAGDRVRAWWRRRTTASAEAPTSGRDRRGRRLFDRFGLPGLAALGPLVTGIHVAAIVALAAGADRRRTLVWLTSGVAVWSVLAALLTVLGVGAFVDADRLPDLRS